MVRTSIAVTNRSGYLHLDSKLCSVLHTCVHQTPHIHVDDSKGQVSLKSIVSIP